jgi:hypothetical protein
LDIPPEVAIKASIKPGSVYYFALEELHSSDAHYFVVINVDPITEEVIILVCASSKVKIVRQRNKNNPAETLVEVSPTQYPDFTRATIFDCNNSVYVQKIETLVERLSRNKLKLKSEMDTTLVERLRQGVLASRLIPLNIKEQLGMGKLPR